MCRVCAVKWGSLSLSQAPRCFPFAISRATVELKREIVARPWSWGIAMALMRSSAHARGGARKTDLRAAIAELETCAGLAVEQVRGPIRLES